LSDTALTDDIEDSDDDSPLKHECLDATHRRVVATVHGTPTLDVPEADIQLSQMYQ